VVGITSTPGVVVSVCYQKTVLFPQKDVEKPADLLCQTKPPGIPIHQEACQSVSIAITN